MEKIIKTLNGYSGSKIYLMSDDTKVFIRKIDNVDRNYERLKTLKYFGFDVPIIYQKNNNILDMEYISGLDMKSYINIYTIDRFLEYVFNLVEQFSVNSNSKNYRDTYYKKLEWMDKSNPFSFTKNELIERLPKILPQSVYHGDLTLENIIYSKNDKFYMIDGSSIDYDSWVFDVCKLRQDLKCNWFMRNNISNNLLHYTKIIDNTLIQKYNHLNNDNLLILMLLRVYPYTKVDSHDRFFILNEVKKLWK
jgi:RIO-like serine/threonine protein kinase